ncbi:MAG: YhcH/YjgK/YiaL family protein [Bacteroidales bacterium]|nr:YhcH/YjgK/YiaL family protein [Bacteroidales bacterium]
MNLLDNIYYRKAMEFIASGKLASLENGKYVIDGDNLFVNICDSELKTPEQARFEAHRKYIDIQVPLSREESYGIMPIEDCRQQDGEFNTEKDIVFFKDSVAEKTIYTAQPGQAVVFSPADAHAPLIGKCSQGTIHKAIFKVKVK